MKYIERLSPPTELDTAQYLTIALVTCDNSAWIQTDKNEENPYWLEFESLEKAQEFKKMLEKKD